jgi:hypothetical protein
MSCHKFVYDLASETEGSPNVFVRKDWINILDNQTQNYTNNQSIIDTSQLSNSNKWMSYREAYLEIPMLLTFGCATAGAGTTGVAGFVGYNPVADAPIAAGAAVPPFSTATLSADRVVGLKNWFGSIIHSFTLDYNGTTIIQQTPFINMWNAFKLLTTLSWQDVMSQGPHIGFYPDDSKGWKFNQVAYAEGQGTCNNGNFGHGFAPTTFGLFDSRVEPSIGINNGFSTRQGYIAYDPLARVGTSTTGAGNVANSLVPTAFTTSSSIITSASTSAMWKSYITGRAGAVGFNGIVQYQIMATVYLKHIHSFFNMVPLLKGVYMKMTMNLNNASTSITVGSVAAIEGVGQVYLPGTMALTTASVPVGGVMPLMISSAYGQAGQNAVAFIGSIDCYSAGTPITSGGVAGGQVYWANLSVGSTITDPTASTALAVGAPAPTGSLARSIYLYVPSYTFNPVFEQAYLSSPVKKIKYTDVYQYQVLGVSAGSTFNSLITNGIANIKSVLVIPFFAPTTASSGLPTGLYPFQSPFDPAGCGTTSPLVLLNNFNVVISGQNAIYNTERYAFEHFINQTYGQGAVNGGLTDGLTSGLIGFDDWASSYCYYYTNVERMLPVEQSVPKSVFLQGVNQTAKELVFWVFVEYGAEVSIDAITGARV